MLAKAYLKTHSSEAKLQDLQAVRQSVINNILMLCWYAWSKRKIYKLLFAAFDEWRSSLHGTIEHPMTVVCEATLGDFLWVKRFSYGIHVATFMRWTRLLQPTMRKPSYSKWLGWDGDASFDSLELGIPGASWPCVSPRARSPAARRTSTHSSGRPETPSTGARHWHIKSHVKRSKAQVAPPAWGFRRVFTLTCFFG